MVLIMCFWMAMYLSAIQMDFYKHGHTNIR